MLAAVKQYGGTLSYAAASLKSDKEVVLAAVKQLGHAFVYAGTPLRSDKELIIIAARSGSDRADPNRGTFGSRQGGWKLLRWIAYNCDCRGDDVAMVYCAAGRSPTAALRILRGLDENTIDDELLDALTWMLSLKGHDDLTWLRPDAAKPIVRRLYEAIERVFERHFRPGTKTQPAGCGAKRCRAAFDTDFVA